MRTSLDNFSAFENQDLITLRIVESRCAITKVRPVSFGCRFQVANTWPKKTGRDVYAMVRNGKERENP